MLTLRDLFQVVFQMKKKEAEEERKKKLDGKENSEPTETKIEKPRVRSLLYALINSRDFTTIGKPGFENELCHF